jgi:hypothetical protein
MVLEQLQRVGRHPGAARQVQEVRDEQRDVLAPVAQRRDVDPHHVQAEVEVLAEAALADALLEVLVRRRDDPDVHRHGLRPAHALELPLLEEAQQLHLRGERDLAHLVQEDRSAAGHLELARLLPDRARERALLVAEELALEQGLGIDAQLIASKGPLERALL